MKIAVIAGEASGDLLGADLVSAIAARGVTVELLGVGGPELERQGLVSLFDYSELSIMGLTAVIKRLPQLIRRIGETARAIIAAKPDLLITIDSPDFTLRVARKVKAALPEVKTVHYVCPSVWAWKEHRAADMAGYIDQVLAILPFEPAVMQRLGGPVTHYVGHRLASHAPVLAARSENQARWVDGAPVTPTILLMPGSRRSEVTRLLDDMLEAAKGLAERRPVRFMLPAVPHLEAVIRETVIASRLPVEIVTGDDAKWRAFASADAAIAASGTAILELALCGIPVVSIYRGDWIMRLLTRRIRIWTAALPNLIADWPAVPEYFNEMVRPAALTRWADRLASMTPERAAQLAAFAFVAGRLETSEPSGRLAAGHVLSLLEHHA